MNLEIALSEDELLRTWLEQHPEHRAGKLIDYTIRAAPGRKQQVVKANLHRIYVSTLGNTAHFSAQVYLPTEDGGWKLINRRMSLGSMEIK